MTKEYTTVYRLGLGAVMAFILYVLYELALYIFRNPNFITAIIKNLLTLVFWGAIGLLILDILGTMAIGILELIKQYIKERRA